MGEKEDKPLIATIRTGGIIYTSVVENNKPLETDKDSELPHQNVKEGFKRSNILTFIVLGNPIKRWTSSPMIVGSLIIFIITSSLVILPLVGLPIIPYPLYSPKTITFNGQENLNWDNLFSESVFLSSGNKISYNVSSNSSFSFGIWNSPFKNIQMADKRNQGNYSGSFFYQSLNSVPFCLSEGDMLNYSFEMGNSFGDRSEFQFFIIDQLTWQDFSNYFRGLALINNYLVNYNPPSNKFNYLPTLNKENSGTFVAPTSNTWYFVWVHLGVTDSGVLTYSMNYNLSNYDFSTAKLSFLNTSSIQNVFTAPTSGEYTIMLYNSPLTAFKGEISTEYNFVFHQSINAKDNWEKISPILILFAGFSILAIFIAIIGRRDYIRKLKNQSQMNQAKLTPTLISYVPCSKCGIQNLSNDYFCSNCGAKLKAGRFDKEES